MIRGPLSFAYSQLMRMRRAAYERNVFSVKKTGCPVISVGNITVGGTGKNACHLSFVVVAFREEYKIRCCLSGLPRSLLWRGVC